MSQPPKVPKRGSSKRPQDFDTLEEEHESLKEIIEKRRASLRPHNSFDAQFWTQATELSELCKDDLKLRKQISIRDFKAGGGTETEWERTPAAQALFQNLRAHEADQKLYKRHSKRLKTEVEPEETNPKSTVRRAWMKLFTTSKMGLSMLHTGAGPREKQVQRNFRKALIKEYNSRNETSGKLRNTLWCPVTSTWDAPSVLTAAHIFPYRHTQDVMDAIFGEMEEKELFSPRNGLIISKAVEDMLDIGFIAIVPDVPDKATKEDIRRWTNAEPKEYKLRVIDPEISAYGRIVGGACQKTWAELDGKKLEFRSDFRPRARYLYFHYCCQILRKAWATSGPHNVLKREFGKHYWGTPGRYLPRSMLLAVIEEIGHEFDALMEGAVDEASNSRPEDSDALLIKTMTEQIKASGAKESGDFDEDDEGEKWNEWEGVLGEEPSEGKET